MKTFKPWFLLCVAAVFFGAVPRASARVSFDFFYDNLQPYGEWVDVADYGYCWHPTGVDEDWAPYSDGYWAYTDGGWTWVSYEDFGGITYHYGRWVRLEDEGWCWVPDYEWAPAWVSWRSSDDYVGWAPLPPRARFHRESGFSVNVDVDYDIGPGYYNFCEYRHFGDPALRGVIVDRRRNVTIINRTTNITNITVNRTTNNVFVGGPQYQTVTQRSTRPIQVLKLRRETGDAAIRGAGSRTLARQQGNQLVVLAPDVAQATPQFKPNKAAKKLAAAKVDRGWNGVTDPAARQQLEAKFKGQAQGHPHAVARPVQAQELKIVDDKIKATPEPAAAVASTPTALPSAAPIVGGGGPKKGKNKNRAPVTNELTAPAVAAPAAANTPGAVTPSEPVITTPKTAPVAKGKNKQHKVPANLSTPTVAAPIVPVAKKEKHAPPQTETQPFLSAPSAPIKPPKQEVTAPLSNPDAQIFAPARAGKKGKNSAPKIEGVPRESLAPVPQPIPRGPEIQHREVPVPQLAPQPPAQGKKGKEKGKDDKKKKDKDDN